MHTQEYFHMPKILHLTDKDPEARKHDVAL